MIKRLQSYFLLLFSLLVFAKTNANCLAVNCCWNNQGSLPNHAFIQQNKEKGDLLPYFTDYINFEEVDEDEGDEESKRIAQQEYTSNLFFQYLTVFNFGDKSSFNKFSKSYLVANRRHYIFNKVFRI